VRTRLLLGALSAMTALLATACSSSPGPLGGGGTVAIACMDYPQGKPVATGIYDLTNSGKSPVTIQSVTLPSAHGLRMTKPWLVPIYHDPKTGDYLDVGAGGPYPPTTSPQWAQRKPAIRGVIRAGQDLNLVFGLTRTSAKAGKSDGPVITYSAGGNTYTVQELTTLVVAATC
jgi:hypothetical protein